MGKPVLGENCRLEVIIEESYDFKVIFWGFSFLESCLSRFLEESLRGSAVRVTGRGNQGTRPSSGSLH